MQENNFKHTNQDIAKGPYLLIQNIQCPMAKYFHSLYDGVWQRSFAAATGSLMRQMTEPSPPSQVAVIENVPTPDSHKDGRSQDIK